MNITELIDARNEVEAEFNNLSNHKWVSSRLDFLKGKYEALSDLINKEQENATSGPTEQSADSDNN